MSEDIIKPKPDHVCYGHWLALHSEISLCQSQITIALRTRRLEKSEDLKINKVPATFEEICWAADVFSDSRQMPHFERNLFEKTNGAIKRTVEETENFIKYIQKRLKGVKIPQRPTEVDEWMKKTK